MDSTLPRLRQLFNRLHCLFLDNTKAQKSICPERLNTQVLSWHLDSVNYLHPLCGLKNETISNSYIAAYLQHRDSNSYMQEQAHHTQGQTRSIFKGCMNLSFWSPRTGYWKPQCLAHTEVHDKYRQNNWMNKEGISRVWLTAAVTLLLGVTLYAVELDWNIRRM